MDKELERRGHPFVRYAEDSLIFCKSKRGAERVCESLTKFIEKKLHLKVNREKTEVGRVRGMKFLGYSFYESTEGWRLTLHSKTLLKLKVKLKRLTSRSNGMGYEGRKIALHQTIRGWVNYFKLADAKKYLEKMDAWLRRRIRMCIWKSWKHPKTRVANLIKCGIKPCWAYQWGNSSSGYWRIAGSPIMNMAVSNKISVLLAIPVLWITMSDCT